MLCAASSANNMNFAAQNKLIPQTFLYRDGDMRHVVTPLVGVRLCLIPSPCGGQALRQPVTAILNRVS